MGKTIKKILKITGKVFLYIIIISVSLVLLSLITVKVFEKKITQMALNEVGTEFKAPFTVEDVNILPLKAFPLLTVELKDFKIGPTYDTLNFGPNQRLYDTLFNFNRVYLAIKAGPLFRNEVDVEKVTVDGINLNYFVDLKGISNFDFLIPTDTTTQTEADTSSSESLLNVLLSDLTLKNINLNYGDDTLKAKACIHIPEMHLNGKMLGDYYNGNSKGTVVLSGLGYEDYNLNNLGDLTFDFNVDYDNGKVKISKMDLASNIIKVSASGNVALTDTMPVDMNVKLTDINFSDMVKLLPAKMLKEFGIKKLEGVADANIKVKGFVYDTLILPSVYIDLNMKNGKVVTTDYPEIKELSMKGSISVPNPNDMRTISANFSQLTIKTTQSQVKMAFSVKNVEKPIYNVKGDMVITLDEFEPFLPDSTLEKLSGSILAHIETNGQLPDSLGMSSADYFLERTKLNIKLNKITAIVDSSTSVRNLSGSIRLIPNRTLLVDKVKLDAPEYNFKLDNFIFHTKLTGSLSDLKTIGMKTDTMLIAFGQNSLSGSFTFKNVEKPTYTLNSNVKLNLGELKPYIPDSLVEKLGGTITANLQSHGTINPDSIEDEIMPIAFNQSKLSVAVNRLFFSMPNDTLVKLDDLSLNFSMADDTMRVNNLYGKTHGIEFRMDSTRVWNVYKALLKGEKDKKLIADTRIWVSDIDYAYFAPLMAEDTTQQETPEQTVTDSTATDSSSFAIPPYIVRGTFAMNSLKYGKMLIKNFSTKFRVDDSLYVVDDMNMDVFSGHINLSALYDTRVDTATVIELKTDANKVDIRQLLSENDEFDQDFITSKNISGLVTGELFARVVMKDTSVLYNKINMLGNFTLEKGGIYNFKPVTGLSKYTGMKELDNIVFRTMETKVFIYDNQIYFPKTSIVSTALDMSVYGMQSFGDDFEYHLEVFPGDVILGKNKKLLKKQGMESDLFKGEDKSKRSGFYLLAKVEGEDSKYGFDNKQAKNLMKAKIRVQERGLNLIFHPRIVNFSTEINRKERKKKTSNNE